MRFGDIRDIQCKRLQYILVQVFPGIRENENGSFANNTKYVAAA